MLLFLRIPRSWVLVSCYMQRSCGTFYWVWCCFVKRIPKVIIESDSSCSVNLLDSGCVASRLRAQLVCCICFILDSFTYVTLRHIFIEANSLVNTFTKHDLHLLIFFIVYEALPNFCFVPLMLHRISIFYIVLFLYHV